MYKERKKLVKCIFVTSTVECFIKKNVFLRNICAIKEGIRKVYVFINRKVCTSGEVEKKLFMMVNLKKNSKNFLRMGL